MESWTKKEEADGSQATGAGQGASSGTTTLPTLTSPADFYRTKPVLDRRIHVLGIGNVGSFIAHAIRGVPNPPPVTLLFPRWERLNEWNDSPQQLALVTEGDTELRSGYDAELAIPRVRYHGKEVGLSSSNAEEQSASSQEPQTLEGESTAPISSLIVCSKAPVVLQGLSAVKHRLHKDSVVLFLQNGMGVVDEVNREIFPDPATRPHYMLGINSHGMHASPDNPFTTVHAGFGTISLGILPHERDRDPKSPYAPPSKVYAHKQAPQQTSAPPGTQDDDVALPTSASTPWTPNQRYLLRTLLRTPVLSATAFSPPDLLQMQLEKLAVNCIINPLSVMLDARNGSVLYNYALTRTMRLLLSEISLVFRSLPELQYIPNVSSRFDPGRLETIVVSVAQKTSDNISSMLADARAGRQTEIDYINGWVVKKGEELGIRCLMNYLMVNLVKGKAQMIDLEMAEGVPFVGAETKSREGKLEIKSGVAGASEAESKSKTKAKSKPKL
ncbi:2-dehydropantoate 2-reductase (Ketopantoate reductase) (KPA reductase) (KPR) [Neodidymelliopsis sp. IMI 364377]|nr:2-dehydropantoate 2-reductase (Ketopantoate reductase) (KPA reductase) (KPR) [Neodidymelliopsis sp. IMI 364377]